MIDLFSGSLFYAGHDHFIDNIQYLLNQIPDKDRVVSLLFFGLSTGEAYEGELKTIHTLVAGTFGSVSPLVSYIAQPVLGGGKLALEVCYIPASGLVEFRQQEGIRYAVYIENDTKILLTEGVCAPSMRDTVTSQGDQIFQKLGTILSNESMKVHEIVRQWNYIGEITSFSDGDQHYQSFNNARADFYKQASWERNGYPAATGIGMGMHGVIVNLIAASCSPTTRIIPLANPMQIAAYDYSLSMLQGNYDSCKKNPIFERGKFIQTDSGNICFISGTAAIRGEESVNKHDAGFQTRITIANIKSLISPENLKRHGVAEDGFLTMAALRVYVKTEADYDRVKAEIEKAWPSVPALYLQADICREELLVEIEGIAKTSR